MANYIVRSPKTLGAAIAQTRKARGLTQTQLAEALYIDRQYVNRLESGSPSLYAARLFEVFRELGLRVELVPEEDE